MDKLTPGTYATIGGGGVLFIATFLNWMEFGPFSFNVYNSTLFGLTGIFLLLIAAACIAIPLLKTLAPQVELPESVVGFTLNQVLQSLGFAVLLLSFSLLFRNSSAEIGTILALLGSIAIVAGTQLETNATG